MSEASEIRRDSKKYLQRCLKRGEEHWAKMTPEERAAAEERHKEIEKEFDSKKIFFDVHEKVVHKHPRCEDMVIDRQEK